MSASKLDQHRDFILQKLQSTSVSQICRDLVEEGCEVSRSYLTEWIEKTAAAQKIKIPLRKRGRPIKSIPAIFSFLPPGGNGPGSATIPQFLLALQEMPTATTRQIRDLALVSLELPVAADPVSSDPIMLKRLAKLTDVELFLLALLRSDLPAPPLAHGHEELTLWFNALAECVSGLRLEIRKMAGTQAT
jgi:hypothetical protein